MGRLGNLGKVIFRIYGAEHGRPHFHVLGPDFEAVVTFDTIEILEGDLPTDVRKAVLAWTETNRARLIAEWTAWNPTLPV